MAKQAALVAASRDNRREQRRRLHRQRNHEQPSSSQPLSGARAARLRTARAANNNLADSLSRSSAISKTTAKAIRARWTKSAQGERLAAAEALGASYKGEDPFAVVTEEEMVEENGGRGVGVEMGGRGDG
ncbi:hypothetical protein MMC30_004536 [Trapelia coarctata]|nr:hypothetical protein [Trapelia coarctata]